MNPQNTGLVLPARSADRSISLSIGDASVDSSLLTLLRCVVIKFVVMLDFEHIGVGDKTPSEESNKHLITVTGGEQLH